MGLLDWLRGTPKPEHKIATWLRGKIAERTSVHDAVGLAQACAALGGTGAMVFGMVMQEFDGRAEVRDEALAALQQLIVTLEHAACEQVFEIVARGELPIDLAARRARWEADRRVHAEDIARAIRGRIAKASAEDLVTGCVQLGRRFPKAFGLELGELGEARAALTEEATARLRALLPALPDAECARTIKRIRDTRLAIEVDERATELADKRQAALASAIAGLGVEPTNPELERAIAEHPDDDHAWSVLADWLTERGHPRGELIALHLGAETDRALAGAAEAHLVAHAEALLGPLAAHRLTHDGDDVRAFEWRRGFIDHARLSVDDNAQIARIIRARDEADTPPDPVDHSVAEILALLLGHPSGRRLATLAIGINGLAAESSLDDVIGELARCRPALRELYLGVFTPEQSEVSWYRVGDVSPLWRALPALRNMVIRGGELVLGAIDHAQLERLEIQTGGLSIANARAIAAAKLPRIRHLDVWYGDPNYGGEATIADVRPLLDRTDLPALDHLGLMNSAFADAICEVLPATPIAAQIRELDLSLGTMSAAGARALAAGAKAFTQLRSVDVSENYLDRESLALLQRAYPQVVSRSQRSGDDDDRYPSVGE